LVSVIVGWSQIYQDNKMANRSTKISSTLLWEKARYSNKAKTVFPKRQQEKKIIFWRECSFPFATIFCCTIKMAFLYLG